MSTRSAYRQLIADTIGLSERTEGLSGAEAEALRQNIDVVWDALSDDERDEAIQRNLERLVLGRIGRD